MRNSPPGFVSRPIAAMLAAITIAMIGWTVVAALRLALASIPSRSSRPPILRA